MRIWSHRGRVIADNASGRADKTLGRSKDIFALRKQPGDRHSESKPMTISQRLPPELLLLIFVRAVHAQFSSGHDSKDRLTSISISHVCQYWRQLTLSCPGIWSCIDTSWRTLAIEFVQRSRAAPLTVFLGLTRRPSVAVVAAMNVVLGKKQVKRIRELRVSADDMNYLNLDFCHRIRASHLQSLSLDNTPHTAAFISSRYPWILSGTLKSLVVNNLYIPQDPDPQMLRNLTRLKITGDARPPALIPRVFDIVKMLQMCPELEEFEFVNGSHVDDMTPPHMTADLRCLRHIHLTMNSRACQVLLSRLTLRPTVNFDIDVSRHREPPEVHPTFSFGNYDALDLGVTYEGRLRMKAYNMKDVENQHTVEVLSIYGRNPEVATVDFTSLQIYFDAMLSQVHSLSIHFDTDGTSTNAKSRWIMWTDILMDLPSLISLTIKVGSHHKMLTPTEIVASLMKALGERDAYERLCLCYSLRTFVLDGIPFTGAAGKSALSHLISFAAAREVGEARIATIDISNCIGVKYRNVQALECFVDEVIWKR
ncbi:hypothetical protein BD410DRAFT_795873 [Rickenella mellea]|uniref:Uncharacterized protein n=1 Tax=Rickenella mellea TaxID=50990 RepID=A0A4Y7PM65_9AGAM|nr:hypothetical protein BD410DRAFT_795873 [Rickenella mellea]